VRDGDVVLQGERRRERQPLRIVEAKVFGGVEAPPLVVDRPLGEQAGDGEVQPVPVELLEHREPVDRADQAENGFDGWRAADVTRAETVGEALADVPRVDHLALLAGTFVAGKVLEADVDHLRKAFDERVWAAVHAVRALGDRLTPDGSITLVSGWLADRPNANGTAVLAAAVAGMEALARGLAPELAPRRVNAVSPGPIDTPLWGKALGADRDAVVEAIKATLPLHRFGTPAEVGAAVVFLMSNGWMTGETLHADGGVRLV
jgi:NAD(P)-dependent dehydrogenase (short-subunit alcohol dehydrogenase family)